MRRVLQDPEPPTCKHVDANPLPYPKAQSTSGVANPWDACR